MHKKIFAEAAWKWTSRGSGTHRLVWVHPQRASRFLYIDCLKLKVSNSSCTSRLVGLRPDQPKYHQTHSWPSPVLRLTVCDCVSFCLMLCEAILKGKMHVVWRHSSVLEEDEKFAKQRDRRGGTIAKSLGRTRLTGNLQTHHPGEYNEWEVQVIDFNVKERVNLSCRTWLVCQNCAVRACVHCLCHWSKNLQTC